MLLSDSISVPPVILKLPVRLSRSAEAAPPLFRLISARNVPERLRLPVAKVPMLLPGERVPPLFTVTAPTLPLPPSVPVFATVWDALVDVPFYAQGAGAHGCGAGISVSCVAEDECSRAGLRESAGAANLAVPVSGDTIGDVTSDGARVDGATQINGVVDGRILERIKRSRKPDRVRYLQP